MNFKNETFIKQYHCINKIKLPNVKVDLTHVTLINIILSYQLNGKDCYLPHKELMEILMVGKTKLYKILDELIKSDLLISNTKRLGPNKGSITNLSINLSKLEEYLGNDTKTPETKESLSEEIKISNYVKTEEVRIPTEDELDRLIEKEEEIKSSKLSKDDKLIKKIAPNITKDDFAYDDILDILTRLKEEKLDNDNELINRLSDNYKETGNVNEFLMVIEAYESELYN